MPRMRASLSRARPLPCVALALAVAGAPPSQAPALRGLDPVALCRGHEVAGDDAWTASHEGLRYRFGDAASRDTFVADPARWAIQLGGACARMGPLSGLGDPDRWLVHDGRIYVFASESCREGFASDPSAHLDLDEPRPAPDTSHERARAQLLAAVRARPSTWRTLRYRTARQQGEATSTRVVEMQSPSSVRVDTEYRDGDRTWRYAHAVSPAGGFVFSAGEAREMAGAARAGVLRALCREPAVALANLGHGVVTARGRASVGGVAVFEYEVWLDGAVTVFGVDADGRVRTARFRGRGPDLRFRELVQVFDDFAVVGGTEVPRARRVLVDGDEVASLTEQRLDVEVDFEPAPQRFEAPK